MIRSTTSFLSAASTFPPSTTEPHGPGLSSFGPRSRVPRLPRRAGSIPPFAIFGRQVDGAVEGDGVEVTLPAEALHGSYRAGNTPKREELRGLFNGKGIVGGATTWRATQRHICNDVVACRHSLQRTTPTLSRCVALPFSINIGK